MKNKFPKVIFFGTSQFGASILLDLAKKDLDIQLVVTQPDRLVGRKQILSPSPVKRVALENNLPIAQFQSLDEGAFIEIKKTRFDLGVVASYGTIIPKKFLYAAPEGFVNVHPSPLPKFRGPSPIQSTLLAGKTNTASTIMLMDEEVDSGPILSQLNVEIDPEDTYISLEEKLIAISNQLLFPTITAYLDKEISPKPQDHSKATQTQTIQKSDGLINWKSNANLIYNQYRAYYNWPKTYTYFSTNNKSRRIVLADLSISKSDASINPGKVILSNNEVLIGTLTKPIKLNQVIPEGSRSMSINEFIKGHPDFIGSNLSNKNNEQATQQLSTKI